MGSLKTDFWGGFAAPKISQLRKSLKYKGYCESRAPRSSHNISI